MRLKPYHKIIKDSYYEKENEVRKQLHYYKYIEELNNSKLFPEKLLITNEEAPLTEEQVKKHFVSIDEQSTAIVEAPGDVNKRFARALDFYLVQDLENALADLNEAIQCEPRFFLPYFNRAMVRYKQIEYKKVTKEYNKEEKKEGMNMANGMLKIMPLFSACGQVTFCHISAVHILLVSFTIGAGCDLNMANPLRASGAWVISWGSLLQSVGRILSTVSMGRHLIISVH